MRKPRASSIPVNDVLFYAVTADEARHGINPHHKNFSCGTCGQTTNGRVVAEVRRLDGSVISWCVCSCDEQAPAVLIEHGDFVVAQYPEAREFRSDDKWPPELAQLYDEAAKSYAAGAYTAAAMVCRKVLMACACQEGATDGDPFTTYVDYITNNVLTFPKAKASIDEIRRIGNDANHDIAFVSRDQAKKAMQIIAYMLNAIYSLPNS